MPLLYDIPITDYHNSDILSKSKLADLDKKGPEYYLHRHVLRTIPNEETDALRLGRIFDGYMDNETRERARWADPIPEEIGKRPSDRERFAKKPSPETLARVAAWDSYLARNHGRELVTDEDRHQIEACAFALNGNPHFAKLWPLCKKQVTIRRELPEFGLSLQSRPDGLCLEHGFAVDVKTIANIDDIPKQTINFAYALQASIGEWLLAQEGHPITWYLAFVEKTEKPRSRMFRIPEVAMVAEWQRCKRLVSEIARRTKDNDWNETHPDEIPVLDLPQWQVKKLEALAVEDRS